MDGSEQQRQAVIDLGSNSFRLVVFTWIEDGWWKRTDEIHDSVRIGEGLEKTGALQPEPMERALRTLELYAHFCASVGIEDVRPVATSAIRDATNQAKFLRSARKRTGLEVEVLATEAEARFGYLAAVNSTTLADGVALDIGGGSMQLTLCQARQARQARSWPLGAVRMTERFLPDKRASGKQIKALRAHVKAELARDAPWLEGAGRLGSRMVGVGGAVRNLAAAAQLRQELPSHGVQGFLLELEVLDAIVEELADLPAPERGKVAGIKPERSDLILAGALVVQTIMQTGSFEALEVTEAGLREGVFFSTLLAPRDPPLFEDVRHAAVCNLAGQYDTDFAHAEHVAGLALELFDALADSGLHPGDPEERDLLWAAGILHDIGVAVDYDDHHKHSRYLILSAGLPGYSTRETALIGQMARYHRKGTPGLGEFGPIAKRGDEARVTRCSALLRVVEQLERARDRAVAGLQVEISDETVCLRLQGEEAPLARWAALQQAELFERAFGRRLEVARDPVGA